MLRLTLVMMFGSVVCEELTPERQIIPLEQITNLKILANWENYELGKLLEFRIVFYISYYKGYKFFY